MATIAMAPSRSSIRTGQRSSHHGAVATDQALATDVGLAVLRAGGNAVDVRYVEGREYSLSNGASF